MRCDVRINACFQERRAQRTGTLTGSILPRKIADVGLHQPSHLPIPRPSRNNMTNKLLVRQSLPQARTDIALQLFQVCDETLDLSWSADRPMARDDSTRFESQNHLQGSNLTLEVCILQVRVITHPENVSSKHNPVSRHEYDRVAISVGPCRWMDVLRLQQII